MGDWLNGALSAWDRVRAYWGRGAVLQVAALDIIAGQAAGLTRI